MRIWTASLVLALCFSEVGLAQTAAPVDHRVRTVIMGIAARRGVKDKDLTHALSDVVLGAYAADANRVVIGPEDLRRALEWEASRQEAGCDDSTCMAEVGAALDAARIVSGTLDALGDGYLLTLAEIDAKSLEPVARAQEEVSKNESELVKATKRLTEQLMAKAAVNQATVSAATFSGASGSIEFNTDPRGAQILVGGQSVGVSPTRIENVAAGRHTVRITRDDYETVDVQVPVVPGGATKVDVEMRIMRAIAEKNLAAKQAKWRDNDEWNQIGGWSKIAGGSVLGLAGVGIGLSGAGDGGLIGGIAVAGVGAALIGWGSVDLLNPPARPIPEWEISRKVTVTPPKGAGDAEVKVIQQAASPAAIR